MSSLIFTAPWVALCSDNRKYKFRFVLSDQYRDAKLLIGSLAAAAAKTSGWCVTDEYVGVHVYVREPDRRRRDLNFSKNLKDGISDVGGVWVDDKQVRKETWEFDTPDKHNAGATITIWRLGDDMGGVVPASIGADSVSVCRVCGVPAGKSEGVLR